jgi:hypothetical protein
MWRQLVVQGRWQAREQWSSWQGQGWLPARGPCKQDATKRKRQATQTGVVECEKLIYQFHMGKTECTAAAVAGVQNAPPSRDAAEHWPDTALLDNKDGCLLVFAVVAQAANTVPAVWMLGSVHDGHCARWLTA